MSRWHSMACKNHDAEIDMTGLYPEIKPYEPGMLEVGDGNLVYWETCGNPRGKPAVVLHGGPGSGCTGWHRRLFDPTAYRVVLFDQRGCGRSMPHASEPDTDLASNITSNLIEDIELLRQRLDVERWLVLGGSWGSTLALAYAERYPARVTEMILFGVTTGRRKEFDWLFRGGAAAFFPEQWERLWTLCRSLNEMATSSTHTIGCCTIPTLRFAGGPRSSGVCGSPRHPRGHRLVVWPRGSPIPGLRWRLRA